MSEHSHDQQDPCCEDPHGAPALRLEQALERMLAEVRPVEGSEAIALRDGLGRILDQDVRSQVDVPAHTNSAMDGYAVRSEDLPDNGQHTLRVIGTAWAGRPFAGVVGPGECARIMTGAPVPPGADTIVIQEHVVRRDDQAKIGSGHRPGQHIRPAGEDIAAGQVALAAGTLLRPAQLGVLASVGAARIRVRRRPRVAFFSTGDELRPAGEPLGEGQIYDSNRYSLFGMLTRLEVEVIDLGIVPDTRDATEQAFAAATTDADAIITTGGVSVGEADFVTETLEKMGEVGFWKVAIKPGRPIAFGRVNGKYFFGLPGNPVSTMATFYQLVQPVLQRLKGIEKPDPDIYLTATCRSRLRKKPGRLEFQRGILERNADGSYSVEKAGFQGAGVLSSMARSNCFIVLPLESETVMPGDQVSVQPFAALV